VWTIADDGTTSNAIKKGPEDIIGIIMPTDAAMTGTKVSFYGSPDGVTYYPIKYQGTAVEVAISTAATINLFAVEWLAGVQYVKIVSDAAEAGGPLTFTPVWRRFF